MMGTPWDGTCSPIGRVFQKEISQRLLIQPDVAASQQSQHGTFLRGACPDNFQVWSGSLEQSQTTAGSVQRQSEGLFSSKHTPGNGYIISAGAPPKLK